MKLTTYLYLVQKLEWVEPYLYCICLYGMYRDNFTVLYLCVFYTSTNSGIFVSRSYFMLHVTVSDIFLKNHWCVTDHMLLTIWISQPWISLKYVGAWVINVNSPQMFPHCARMFIHMGLDSNISFQGVGNLKAEILLYITDAKICNQVTDVSTRSLNSLLSQIVNLVLCVCVCVRACVCVCVCFFFSIYWQHVPLQSNTTCFKFSYSTFSLHMVNLQDSYDWHV